MINKEFSAGMGTLALALAAVLAGCNGGGGSTASTPTSTISGVVTGFGSVYVNGVEYNTDGASISVDDVPGNDDYDLAVGMKVTLTGTVNADGLTGSTSSINYADELEGVVLANSVAADGTGTMNIMGQTVTITLTTVFESHVPGVISVDGIAAGNVVEVSGYSSGDGSVYATRIEVKAPDLATYMANNPGSEMEVKGVVSGLASASQTFNFGNLIVDYSAAIQVPSGLDDGLYVEVKSNTAPVDNGDGTFTLAATRVEVEDDGIKGIHGDSGEEIELKGVITNIDNLPAAFDLDGQTIQLVSETEFEDGLLSSSLAVGDMVQVEGYFSAPDQLVADSVELGEDDASLTEYKDYVQSVDAVNSTVTLQGGQVITVTNTTIMQDSLDINAEHYFDLTDLHAGDYLEVYTYLDASSNLVAAKLERDDGPVI